MEVTHSVSVSVCVCVFVYVCIYIYIYIYYYYYYIDMCVYMYMCECKPHLPVIFYDSAGSLTQGHEPASDQGPSPRGPGSSGPPQGAQSENNRQGARGRLPLSLHPAQFPLNPS